MKKELSAMVKLSDLISYKKINVNHANFHMKRILQFESVSQFEGALFERYISNYLSFIAIINNFPNHTKDIVEKSFKVSCDIKLLGIPRNIKKIVKDLPNKAGIIIQSILKPDNFKILFRTSHYLRAAISAFPDHTDNIIEKVLEDDNFNIMFTCLNNLKMMAKQHLEYKIIFGQPTVEAAKAKLEELRKEYPSYKVKNDKLKGGIIDAIHQHNLDTIALPPLLLKIDNRPNFAAFVRMKSKQHQEQLSSESSSRNTIQ